MTARRGVGREGAARTSIRAMAAVGPGLRPLALALLAVESQVLDAATWLLAVGRAGIGGEANPLAATLFHAGGVDGVLALKLVGAIVLAALAARLAGRWWALLPAVVGLLGALTNLAALR